MLGRPVFVCHSTIHSVSPRNSAQNQRQIRKLEDEVKQSIEKLLSLEKSAPETTAHGHDRLIFSVSPHTVTSESIAVVVQKATNIPVQRLLASDKSHLLNLESALNDKVRPIPDLLCRAWCRFRCVGRRSTRSC